MATSEPLAQWDVVVLPFPYTDRLAEKRRPALIVSKPWVMKDFGLLWVAMITSAGNERWGADIEISSMAKSGLLTPSVIRPVKIATIEADRVLRKLGGLGPKEIRAVKTALSKILG
jgi:mRNA interferase MazF